jgi:hypothetical protein
MTKKIICLGVILAMIFSLMGCIQGNKLKEYKASANTTIETYAQEKGQDNYTVENWAIIERLVTEGKAAVEIAKTKDGVAEAVETAKQKINAVQQEGEMGLRQGFYITDDNSATIRLYGDNMFSFKIIYISYLSTGSYSIENEKLIFNYTDKSELLFEIGDDQLVFIGANTEGVEEGPLEVGTIFKFSENAFQELQQGVYATDDGMASVTLVDDQYIFDRHSGTNYRPTGNYTIDNGKLTLYIEDNAAFVFDINDGQLVFVSGHLAEFLVAAGTIFKLVN